MNELEKILGVTFPNNTVITNATNTTKKVKKNSIFFGLQGTKVHGSKYIEEAFRLGATIAIHDDPNFKINNEELNKKIFYIEDIDKPWEEEKYINKKSLIYVADGPYGEDGIYINNKLLVFLSALNSNCDFISREIGEDVYNIPRFIGFTGTNGKTTSAHMAYQISDATNQEGHDPVELYLYIGTLGIQYSIESFNKERGLIEKYQKIDASISNKTTPDIFEIFEILNLISAHNFKETSRKLLKVFLEVSSHALDQGRLKYIPFNQVVLMNIGSDHLDYHKSIYEYEKSKLKIFDLAIPNIFKNSKYIGIDSINLNNNSFKEYFRENEMPTTVSFKNKSADIYCQINEPIRRDKENTFKLIENKTQTRFLSPRPTRNSKLEPIGDHVNLLSRHTNDKVYIEGKESVFHSNILKEEHNCYGVDINLDPWRNIEITTTNPDRDYVCRIFPEFNIHNLVFGIILSISPTSNDAQMFYNFEMPRTDVFYHEYKNLYPKSFGMNYPILLSERVQLPPGRTQIVTDIPDNVIIDYAHNAEGFDFFLLSIKDHYQKLVIVFGCGGDRDKDKRPKMLAAAIKYGDKIIFTSDNSRSERFEDIFNNASEDNNIKDVLIIEDRKEAITKGSKLIGKDDCLVILGKGHEETQEIDGKISKFSDYEVVHEIYK